MQLGAIIAARPRSESSDEPSVIASATAPKRKTHRKSRGGCLSCKQRHKRCDERRPLCSSCLVRGQECIYPAPFSLASENPIQNDEAKHASGPSTLLSATPSDPFDVSPVKLPYLSSELLNHIIYYRTHIRKVFGFSQPIDISLGNTTFYQTALLIAAGHTSLARPLRRNQSETFTYHKLEIIKSVKDLIQESPQIPEWMGCIVSGLVLANADNREYEEANAHLKGLFKILDIYESQGQVLSAWLLARVTIMPLALILASAWDLPYRGAKSNNYAQQPPSTNLKSLWAETSYLYELFVIEFLRYQMTSTTPKKGRTERLDTTVLKWLYDLQKNEKAGRLPTQTNTDNESTAAEGDGSESSVTIPYRTHSSKFPDETWTSKIAVGAFALSVGIMQPWGVQVDDASSGSKELNTQDRDWLDDWIGIWRKSDKPFIAWPWEQLLHKIAWLETDEGLDFIKTVYEEAAKGQKEV